MKLKTGEKDDSLITVESELNRRRGPRMDGRFGLTFSGRDGGRMMISDGHVMDLSREGIGVRSNRLVRPGMELALFLELPDSEDHLCVPEARVSWVTGQRFGVSLRTIKLEDHNRLRVFLWNYRQQKPV